MSYMAMEQAGYWGDKGLACAKLVPKVRLVLSFLHYTDFYKNMGS